MQIIGKVKDRQWKADREFEKLCPDCWEIEKQRRFDEENQRAAAEATEQGLPELAGTEKQMAWANTLRQKWTEKAEKYIEHQKEIFEDLKERHPENTDATEKGEKLLSAMIDAVDRILLAEDEARYWIDTRYDDPGPAISKMAKQILSDDSALVPEAVKAEAIEDMTMRPAKGSATTLITEIRVSDETVAAHLPEKNEEFRLLLRELRFSWENGCWQRKTGITIGTPMDRAAELGIKLLAAGFPIRVYSEGLQEQILSGQYKPECDRWILRHENGFRIWWDRKAEDFYDESKRLPGSRWLSEKRSVYVPPEAFRELQDFAERYQFQLTENAQANLDEARRAFESAMVADVTIPVQETLPEPGCRPILDPEDVSGEINESLRDEN
ncbi:MAG: hypothetical protein PHI87_06140 [Candidatus Methanomethylophilus sp.]|nr:hypothetical protein [Methanomethylophilus sp.]